MHYPYGKCFQPKHVYLYKYYETKLPRKSQIRLTFSLIFALPYYTNEKESFQKVLFGASKIKIFGIIFLLVRPTFENYSV